MDINLELQTKKLELIHWLSSIDDLRIIDKISKIRKEEKSWWNDIADAEKKMIEEGLKDVKEGNVVSHEDFLKSYGK
ncbi:hypothetical protein ACFQO9_18305 [Chryseobacterium zhengzhouense]|uniref:Addiction module protein n=1 Tax=Chryseobacterium zhengzhouense TaxID=1636086 RepID=A0ABW2M5K7_9FLAO